MRFDVNQLKWTREPAEYEISSDKIEIITKPHTDLWQRTYYHFRNDNAPVQQKRRRLLYRVLGGWRMTGSSRMKSKRIQISLLVY